jgi:hypothetical protein
MILKLRSSNELLEARRGKVGFGKARFGDARRGLAMQGMVLF